MKRHIHAILLEAFQAVYVEIPKVACTSIKTALAEVIGLSLAPAGGDPHLVTWPTASRSKLATGSLFPGQFSFAFVRNPWDRLVSCYRDKIRGDVDGYTHFTVRPGVANCLARFGAFVPGMSFKQFVVAVAEIPDEAADKHFQSQNEFVTNEDGNVAVDFIGHFERLAEDFRTIQDRIGVSGKNIPWLQKVRDSMSYVDFYDNETRALTTKRYRRDVELFGYAFGDR